MSLVFVYALVSDVTFTILVDQAPSREEKKDSKLSLRLHNKSMVSLHGMNYINWWQNAELISVT